MFNFSTNSENGHPVEFPLYANINFIVGGRVTTHFVARRAQQKLKNNMCSKFNILTFNNGEPIWGFKVAKSKKVSIFGDEKFTCLS